MQTIFSSGNKNKKQEGVFLGNVISIPVLGEVSNTHALEKGIS